MQNYLLSGSKSKLFCDRIRLRMLLWRVNLRKFFLNDYDLTVRIYKKRKGVNPNLENPITFSEKLSYLKLHYRNPLQTLCADKYYAAEYVKACGFGNILKKTYGVFNNAEDIDFIHLPNKFFLKCNHWSGFNYIVDKNRINQKHTKKLFRILLKHNYYMFGREWPYKNIQPRVICEEVLSNKDGSSLVDYKFYCFMGEPKYFMVSYGEYEHDVKNHKFDMNLQSIDHYFKQDPTLDKNEIIFPDNIDEMILIVRKLCEPFPHVRVDLYNIDGRIVFGELTFYSSGGIVNVASDDYDKEIASWIDLAVYKNDMI